VRNIVNMAMIAVVDAQLKSQVSAEEVVKRSPWWKRLKRRKEEVKG
jgi:malate dehydrogenase (oxaloacetate-decarboxylating)(NADP+)